MVDFTPPVAPLFVPGDRPERFEKAIGSSADAIIIDLEDSVSSDRKDMARNALANIHRDALKTLIVRVNARESAWFEDDVKVVAAIRPDAVMLPKLESGEVADFVRNNIGTNCKVIGLIETARAITALNDICIRPNVAQLAFGSIDYAADVNCEHTRDALLLPRLQVVQASRAFGLPAPLDGVTTETRNRDQTQSDAEHSASLGFGGKLAIHPTQIAPIITAFRPSTEDVAWARRVLEAAESANGAVVSFDGIMIDAPVYKRALQILARASS